MKSKIRGTTETAFQIGLGGPQLKDDTGEIDARNAADAAYVNVRGADPIIADDLVTKRYVTAPNVSYTPAVLTNWPPTAPTNVQTALDDEAWERGFEINFVTDCGADPTGVVDCAPAFDAAFALLSALAVDRPVRSSKLYIPPGNYALLSAPTIPTWNFNTLTSALLVCGTGMDNTIIELNGFDPPALANLLVCEISDLTLRGMGNGTPNDCVLGWSMQSVFKTASYRRVHAFNLKAQFATMYVALGQAVVHFQECVVTCCSSQTAGWGTVTVDTYTNACVEDCTFTDVGTMNGVPNNGAKLLGNQAWLQFNNTVSGGVFTLVKNCFFDENCIRDIYVKGAPGALTNVVLENIFCNPPAQAPETACVQIDNAVCVTINGLVDSGLAHFSTANSLSLVAVGSAYVRNLFIDPTSPSRIVTADAACGYLEIETSNVADVDVHSSAALTTIKQSGQTADLYTANGAILAHQLAKDVTGGPIAITTTDQIDVVTGAARQATTGAGQHVALSRFGTPTVFLSDGTATIAIGDNLGISPTSPGRVRTVAAGAARVGVATAAAVAVADTPVNGYFAPLGVDQTFSTFAANNPTLVPATGGRPNILQAGVVNANLPAITSVMIGQSIVVLCDGIASATVTAAGGQTIQEVGAGAPATPQTVTGSATFLAFNSTTWIMTP